MTGATKESTETIIIRVLHETKIVLTISVLHATIWLYFIGFKLGI